ncbi:MAG: DivIVA domain-containing protein [Clostridia bacterium]|nr:DivIVA domain-containing protein [Clostridia bacterium]
MAITVDDIQKKQFSTRSRGYDKFEVDTFLEDIMMQMEQTETELDELRSKCSSLYETINVYKQTEDSMKEVLLIAKEKKDDIIDKANEEAEKIVADAKAKADEMLNGMDVQIEMLKKQTEDMKAQYADFKTKFEELLKSQLDAMDRFGKEAVQEAAE